MRAWWDWRPFVAWAVVTLVVFVIGFSFGSAALVGLLAAAVVMAVRRLDTDPDPDVERERADRRDGARGDLQELTWAMTGRDGRIGERVLRRLRTVGAVRLARHGLTLADPADEAAIRALLDDRAWATLTRTRSPLPSVADVRHTVTLLERLRTDPGRPA